MCSCAIGAKWQHTRIYTHTHTHTRVPETSNRGKFCSIRNYTNGVVIRGIFLFFVLPSSFVRSSVLLPLLRVHGCMVVCLFSTLRPSRIPFLVLFLAWNDCQPMNTGIWLQLLDWWLFDRLEDHWPVNKAYKLSHLNLFYIKMEVKDNRKWKALEFASRTVWITWFYLQWLKQENTNRECLTRNDFTLKVGRSFQSKVTTDMESKHSPYDSNVILLPSRLKSVQVGGRLNRRLPSTHTWLAVVITRPVVCSRGIFVLTASYTIGYRIKAKLVIVSSLGRIWQTNNFRRVIRLFYFCTGFASLIFSTGERYEILSFHSEHLYIDGVAWSQVRTKRESHGTNYWRSHAICLPVIRIGRPRILLSCATLHY